MQGERVRRGFRWNFGLGREVGLVLWAMVCDEASMAAFMGIWPLWIAFLGAPVTVVGLVLGAMGILRLVVLSRAAQLSERIQPRTLAVFSRIALATGLVTAGLADHWTQLLPMLVLSAIGVLASPVAKSHVSDHAGEERVRAYSLVFSVAPAVSIGISPLIAGLLIARYGMAAAFFYAACWSAASAVIFSRLGPGKPRPAEAGQPRSSFRTALAEPGVRWVLGLQAATVFAMSIGTSLLPTFLEEVQRLEPATIAALASSSAVGSVIFGLAVARSGRMRSAPMAGIALCVGFVALAFAVCLSTNVVWIIAIAYMGRGGLFSAWGLFSAALAEVASDRNRMRIFSMGDMGGNIAFWSAPILSGQLYAVTPALPLLTSIVASLAMLPALLAGHRQARKLAPETAT
jgi:MFS transporter, ENTS family, enterobactin (siderophore) exporter